MRFGDKDFRRALDFLDLTMEDFERVRASESFERSRSLLKWLKKKAKIKFRQAVQELHPDKNLDLDAEELEAKQLMYCRVVEAAEIIEKLEMRRPLRKPSKIRIPVPADVLLGTILASVTNSGAKSAAFEVDVSDDFISKAKIKITLN